MGRLVWVLCLLVPCACTVTRPSAELRCSDQSDCEAGRVCIQGFCAVDDPNDIDATPIDDGASGIDAVEFDSAVAVLCTDWIFNPAHFDPCAIENPSPGLALDANGEYVYDTTNGTLTDPGDNHVAHANSLIGGLRIASLASLEIGSNASLRVEGDNPLVIASWSTVVIDGELDTTSDTSPGAGANPIGCPTLDAAQNDGGGGGGGGGGFGAAGGTGGAGDNGVGTPGPAGTADVSTALRGGCPGGRGGEADQGPSDGVGGDGGGAVFVTAFSSVTVNGTAHAGGGGGAASDGDPHRTGGGGGGSGGMLGFEAPNVTFSGSATVAANGGGGGGGSNNAVATPGESGRIGTVPAAGGTGETGQGGDGGDGGAGTPGTGENGLFEKRGGGGGGGGVGSILVFSTAANTGAATTSPPVTLMTLN